MLDFADRNLAYHQAEVARLKNAIARARPNARHLGLLRTILMFHEDVLSRPSRDPLR